MQMKIRCLVAPATMIATAADYRVFKYPLEAPNFGSRTLLTDPYDITASPYGWHDVNGIAGEDYTITRGNNVYAYEDANNDNLPGYSPDGGVNLDFDFPFTLNGTPIGNQDASLTNLFYDNNTIHDYLYPLGFTEAAGNFQKNNYGRGGLGNDYVKAEGFDGSGTNNANFNTPPDGFSGRMQMYLWTGVCSSLNVSSSTYTGPMTVGTADFSSNGTVTANLILVNDGVGTTTDACSAISNSLTGKVALIDRGTCNFINKAQAAQAKGAIAVIIANNVSGAPQGMTGTPTLTIPVISITLTDGNTLKSALLSGTVTVTVVTCTTANQIDGSFDNGVVSHEYGHGVSNRLTGGPSQASCLGNAEQGGEGWSDWLALMMTMKPGDLGSNARGVGTYVRGQPSNGPGLRRYPYSTNMSINPQTYADIAANPEVHAIGEIWCDAIWDMSCFLTSDLGFSSDPYNTTAGNNIAMRLVLEGMKLQPCGPGFLDARDAILMADAELYNNVHRCRIWEAFARRGMGFDANQGSANVAGDETAGFQMPPFCSAPTQIPVAAFTSDISTVACGGSVKFTDQSVQAFDWLWEFGDQTTSTLQNPLHTFTAPGTYSVKLTVSNPLGSSFAVHAITVTSTFSVSVTATPNPICLGAQVQLNAIASGATYRSYTVSNISYSPVSGTGTAVSLGDDQVSGALPIGFTFNFFGQNYNNFYACSNGFITFTASMPATPVYGQFIPSTSDPDNFIALCWNDLYPPNAAGSVSYFTTGSSPTRRLVVNYNTVHYAINDPPFTSYPFIVQAILYEGSNNIEIHTTTISDVSPYDESASTTQGIENSDGSQGVPVPGRNGEIFSASNDAYRFIQYIPYSYSWSPGNLNGASQTVSPVSTVAYTVRVSDGTSCLVPFTTPVINVTTPTTYYADVDGDTYGSESNSQLLCAPSGIYTATRAGDCNDNNANIHPGVPDICNGIDDNCDGIIDPGCTVTLNLKLYIQGFYTGNGMMDNNGQGGNLYVINTLGASPTDVDTVFISAMNPSTPYAEVDKKSAILQTNGQAMVNFNNTVIAGNSYYIKVRHRNSVSTWSKIPVLFSTVTSYNFTTSSSQAFDDGFNLPMKLVDTSPARWAIFNGDVDQDGDVDSGDMTIEENNSNAGFYGYYSSDLNGDGGSDALDMTIIENNGNAGVFEAHP